MAAPKGNKFAKGNQGGRPELYTQEWLKSEALALDEWIKETKENYIGSFAYNRGYHRRRMNEFVHKSDEFARAYERAQQWQENKFVNNAVTRLWDSGFTQYIMARVCGEEFRKAWDQPVAEDTKGDRKFTVDD